MFSPFSLSVILSINVSILLSFCVMMVMTDDVTFKKPFSDGEWHQQGHVARKLPGLTEEVSSPKGTLLKYFHR